MKKIFCIAAFAGIFTLAYCQDVKVNINNHEATTKGKVECPYRINGICCSEDIGGINVDIVFADECSWAVFTNHNPFEVTTLYEIGHTGGHGLWHSYHHDDCIIDADYEKPDGATGSIVLAVGESKKIKLDAAKSHLGDKVFISDNSDAYFIRGLITRKITK